MDYPSQSTGSAQIDHDPQTPAHNNIFSSTTRKEELSPPELTRWTEFIEKYPGYADIPKEHRGDRGERKRREHDVVDKDFSLEEFGDPFDDTDMVEKL
ncbi:hypothetical protein N7495_003789 [Penicillium taxi]|uniref:uncharacterized protein n=1 Tax=Penicillium taxi TaxID=168475 RepID=UPI00254510F6|nr:uncharacterized protein N7495_003789 [Penicillium taxi]KAJ5899045.1 hypothetical protein N7495_003789 [Penicillium taxi]